MYKNITIFYTSRYFYFYYYTKQVQLNKHNNRSDNYNKTFCFDSPDGQDIGNLLPNEVKCQIRMEDRINYNHQRKENSGSCMSFIFGVEKRCGRIQLWLLHLYCS